MVFKKGHKISEAQKKMMKKRMTGKKNPFYGKTHSEELKKKMRQRVQSKETRKKISLAGKGRKHTEATKKKMLGRKHTEATKKKMKGRVPWNKGKPMSEEHKKKFNFKGGKHTAKSKKKIRLAGIGRKHTADAKKKIGQAQKGKKLSEKTIQKMKVTMKRRFPQGRIPWHKGKTGVFSEEVLEKIRKSRAKQILPRKNSAPEITLQKVLKSNKIKFISHKNFNLGFQRHQVDVFIEPNICIEVDGDHMHANPKPHRIPKSSKIRLGYKAKDVMWRSSKITKTAKWIWDNDKKQTKALKKLGNKVLRLWQSEIDHEPEKCIKKILKMIQKR